MFRTIARRLARLEAAHTPREGPPLIVLTDAERAAALQRLYAYLGRRIGYVPPGRDSPAPAD